MALTLSGILLLLLSVQCAVAFSLGSERQRDEVVFLRKWRPFSTRIFTSCNELDSVRIAPAQKECLYDLANDLLMGSSLIYTYSALRKKTLEYINDNGKESLDTPALILTQDGAQGMPTDHHRYLHYPVTIPALQKFVQLNRCFVTSLKDGDTPLWTSDRDQQLVKLAQANVEIREFDDQFNNKELVYGVVLDRTNKRIIVIFRGSVTAQDWKHNLQAALKCKLRVSDRLQMLGFKGTDVYAHRGFCGYLGLKNARNQGIIERIGQVLESKRSQRSVKWENIISNVLELYKSTKDKPEDDFSNYSLYITGHSLGGALAQLFSFCLASSKSLDDYPSAFPVTAVTFASPTVGDNDTYQQANNLLEKGGRLRHIRYSNEGDVVPVLPPQFMGFTQTGVNIHVSEKDPPAAVGYRNLKSLRSQLGFNVLDHHNLNEYIERMNKNEIYKTITVEDAYQTHWKKDDI